MKNFGFWILDFGWNNFPSVDHIKPYHLFNIHHPSSIIHHPSSIIHHPSSIIQNHEEASS